MTDAIDPTSGYRFDWPPEAPLKPLHETGTTSGRRAGEIGWGKPRLTAGEEWVASGALGELEAGVADAIDSPGGYRYDWPCEAATTPPKRTSVPRKLERMGHSLPWGGNILAQRAR